MKINDFFTQWYLLFYIWLISAIGTVTSLFFSNVMGVPVCDLCWYQRIALYPMAIIIPLGLFPFDPRIIRYVAPLVLLGWFVAMFQVLLIMGVIPEQMKPCTKGIPCSITHFEMFGFLNIPLMSLIVFTLVGILLFFAQQKFYRNNINE